jgi:hypothetical protein
MLISSFISHAVCIRAPPAVPIMSFVPSVPDCWPIHLAVFGSHIPLDSFNVDRSCSLCLPWHWQSWQWQTDCSVVLCAFQMLPKQPAGILCLAQTLSNTGRLGGDLWMVATGHETTPALGSWLTWEIAWTRGGMPWVWNCFCHPPPKNAHFLPTTTTLTWQKWELSGTQLVKLFSK